MAFSFMAQVLLIMAIDPGIFNLSEENNMSYITLTDANFQVEVLESRQPILGSGERISRKVQDEDSK